MLKVLKMPKQQNGKVVTGFFGIEGLKVNHSLICLALVILTLSLATYLLQEFGGLFQNSTNIAKLLKKLYSYMKTSI